MGRVAISERIYVDAPVGGTSLRRRSRAPSLAARRRRLPKPIGRTAVTKSMRPKGVTLSGGRRRVVDVVNSTILRESGMHQFLLFCIYITQLHLDGDIVGHGEFASGGDQIGTAISAH